MYESLSTYTENYWIRIVLAVVLAYGGAFLIQYLLQRLFVKTNFFDEKKEKTIEGLVKSFTNYGALLIVLFVAIDPYLDITKLLAGAGVLGIIIGFGAQSIIKDILTGFFLIYEKQIRTGDFVAINGKYTGTVEEIGLRILKVREWSGKLLHISNGEIKEIQNYNIDRMRVIERVVVSFREEPEKIISILEKTCEELNEKLDDMLKRDTKEEIIEKFQVYGMTNLNAGYHGYEYTIVGLVKDEMIWNAGKEVRRSIANSMYKENIKMAEENVRYQARMHLQ